MVIYLNNAGQALLSQEVREAGIAALERMPWEPHGDDDQQRIRECFASLIDAESSDIAMMPCTAFAITMASRNIQRSHAKSTGKILLLQDQYNSAVYPWQQMVEESNGSIRLEIIPHPDPDVEDGWTKAILDRIDPSVIVACLPPLHWSNGALIDLETIGRACRENDIPLIVDATQAVGIMQISVKKIQPTFLACSVHKWLRSPSGCSLVFVDKKVRSSWIPLDYHARSRDLPGGTNWEAKKNGIGPNGYPETFFDDSRKFDSGGKPNPIILPMLRASLEQVVLIDREKAQESFKTLTDPLVSWARSHGYIVPGEPRAYHLVGIEPPGRTVDELLAMANKLKMNGIIVAVRCGGLRISPYLNTTASDMQSLIHALENLD